MKCIRHLESEKISRVSDTLARIRVLSGPWEYVQKKDWKEQARVPQPEATSGAPTTKSKPEKGEKAHAPQKRRSRSDRRRARQNNPGGK